MTETAGSAILDLPDVPPTLAVERFDRVETERGLVRLHQEDCAQALGIEPGRKYAATATPTKSDPTYKALPSCCPAMPPTRWKSASGCCGISS